MTPPLPADFTPVAPGQVVPEDWTVNPITQRPLPSRVELALASPDLWSPRANMPARRAAAILNAPTKGLLGRAVRAADALEYAAVRRAPAIHDQVLHVGYGLDRIGGALRQLWQDVHVARSQQRTVAVTCCRYAYGYARNNCDDVPTLLYSYPQHLGGLLDNPYLHEHLDLERPVALVLAGLHRNPRSSVDALLTAALKRLAPGSTLTLVGIAVTTTAARRRLEQRWNAQTDQYPLIVHPPSLTARLAELELPGWGAPELLAPGPDDLPLQAFGALYRRT